MRMQHGEPSKTANWLQAQWGSHKNQLISFGLIGGGVFVLGVVLLHVFVSNLGMSPGWGFFWQGIVSVEVSYLLNWRFTWGYRQASFLQSLLRFNISRGLTIPLNQGLYVAFIWLGMGYQVANVVETAIFIVVNYFIGHLWSFKSNRHSAPTAPNLPHDYRRPLPTVSVVVPVKRSHKTIRACVQSLLNQDYPIKLDIVLVGDVDDSTWLAIDDLLMQGVIRAYETRIVSAGRDANAKRNIGLIKSVGSLIAMTDSDMVLPIDWVSNAVSLIREGWGCVAGPMKSLDSGFWPSYVDESPFLAKTPRMSTPYVVTSKNFGRRGYMPPITASVMFTREVYDATGPFNDHITRSYEDYEWFDHMTQAGVAILCTPVLVGGHAHREGFRILAHDYKGTGWGCADFVHFNPDSVLSRKRTREVQLVSAALVLTPVALGVVGASTPYGVVWLLCLAALGYLSLAVYCFTQTRKLWSLLFPAIGIMFGFMSWLGFLRGMRSIKKSGHIDTVVESIHRFTPRQEARALISGAE